MPKEKKSKTDIKRELISTMIVQGMKKAEIARRLNLSPQTVDKYVNQDEDCKRMIEEKFANIKEDGMKKIKENYSRAIDQMILLMDQDDDLSLKFKASQYIMECVNGKPAQQQKIEATVDTNVTTINVNITDDE